MKGRKPLPPNTRWHLPRTLTKRTPARCFPAMTERTPPGSRSACSSSSPENASGFPSCPPPGICLSWSLKNSPCGTCWRYMPPLSGSITPAPLWQTPPRTRWTRPVTLLQTPPPAPNGPANSRPWNCSSRSRVPRRTAPPARSSVPMPGYHALCRIALLIRLSIS